jgi:multicomponent Na+:H+ antiporter subunit D
VSPGLLAAAAAIPFAAALLILLVRRAPAALFTYPAAGSTAAAAIALLAGFRSGEAIEARLLPIVPGGDLLLRADGLGLTFALLAAGLWTFTSVYSSGYERALDLRNRRRFAACFAASIGSAMGVAFAGNLLTFLVFYELLTICTYPLVAHAETPKAIAAARRYLVYSLTAGLALTAAVAWTWALAGRIDFVPGGIVPAGTAPGVLAGLLALYLLGCGVKAAVMPLHAWLPEAMVAPTPVSALLHAVAVVKAGVFGFLRVLHHVFGPEVLSGTVGQAALLALCGFTIVAGSLIALRQDQLKRRLAYSTIVHLSYIVLGAALLSPRGLEGAMLHMSNHGFAKITLFFCAGAIHAAAHVDRISELGGLARRMPWTFGAFTVASLGLVGVPGLCGFVGKLFLARGALEADQWVLLGVLVGGGVLSAAYLFPIIRAAYFERPEGSRSAGGEGPAMMVVPLLLTAALVVVFGLWPAAIGLQHDLAAGAASQVFPGCGR